MSVAMLAACVPSSSADDAVHEARSAVESCVDANLGDVERAFENLYYGSAFLLNGICLTELGAAQEAYQIENTSRLEIALTQKCGPIVDADDDRLQSYPAVGLNQSLENAEARQTRLRVEECHRQNSSFGMISAFGVPEPSLAYDALESIEVIMTAYASKRLLELRIARLDGHTTGDN